VILAFNYATLEPFVFVCLLFTGGLG